MQKKERVKQKLHDAMKSINDVLMKKLVPDNFDFRNCSLSVPIDKYLADKKEKALVNPAKPMSTYKSSILDFLSFCFGPLEANPNNPGNVAAQKALYTFPTTSEIFRWPGKILTEKAFQNINRSDEIVEQFAEELSDLAHENRELYEMKKNQENDHRYDLSSRKTILSRHSKIILLGKRGSGKTVFINYLLSSKHHIFTQKNVLWFRIDLTRGNFNLQEWMRWQMLHILFKYYDNSHSLKNESLNLSANNNKLLSRITEYRKGQDFGKSFESYFDSFKSRLRNDINYTKTKSSDEDEQDYFSQTIPSSIFKGIWDYLTIDRKKAILFVIDGLDQLGLTDEDRVEFDQKLQDVRNYIFNPEAESAAYLITMRYESYQYRAKDLHSSSHLLTMEDVDPYDIILKRIEYIRSGKALLPRSLRSKKFNLFEPAFSTSADLCISFLKFITTGLTKSIENRDTDDPRFGMILLNSIYNNDRRKLFLALQAGLSYFFRNILDDFDEAMLDSLNSEYLGEKTSIWSSKYYLVIEGWLLDHHSYHLNRYLYYFDPDDQTIKFERGAGPDYLPNERKRGQANYY